jgi:hypothetical protein
LVENKGQFALDYNQDSKDYVGRARTGYQGAVQRSIEQSFDTQTSVQTRFDLNEFVGFIQSLGPKKVDISISPAETASGTDGVVTGGSEAKSTGQATGTPAPANKGLLFSAGQGALKFGAGPDTSLEIERGEVKPTTPALSPKLPIDSPAQEALSSEKFRQPLPQIEPPSAVSERQALLIGLNDKLTENVLKYLVNPAGVADKKVYLAVFDVTCTPGWRTRQGYYCDIHVTLDYAKPAAKFNAATYESASDSAPTGAAQKAVGEARAAMPDGGVTDDDAFVYASVVDKNERQPVALSLFPSQEAQVLDLRNSEREQISAALYLSALLMGAGSQTMGENLTSYVERLEYDAATRTPIPVVSSYTDGFGFGFRVMPSFQALGDPMDKEAGSANVLHPHGFPAVVLLICEKDELDPNGLGWDHVVTETTTRWIPMERIDYVGRALPITKYISRYAINFPNSRPHRLSMQKRIGIAEEVDRAWQYYELSESSSGASELERRIRSLSELATGESIISRLPESPSTPAIPDPKIVGVQPTTGWINADTLLAIEGSGFAMGATSIVKKVTVGGRDCEFEPAGVSTIVARVPAWPERAAETFEGPVVVVTTKGVAIAPQPTRFEYRDMAVTSDPSVSVERNPEGLVTKIVISESGSVSAAALLDTIRQILSTSGATADVDIDVRTGD